MSSLLRLLAPVFGLVLTLTSAAQTSSQAPGSRLTPRTLHFSGGRQITLSLPANLDIDIAAEGLRRVRFLAQAPDGRIFATGMYNLADNTRGAIFLLGGWDPAQGRFTKVTIYLDHLRNPNNLAFWTDPAGKSWLYLPLTDRLLRFPYKAGDLHPSGAPKVLMRFPDYGLSYKYGGWHLTRTVAVATLGGRTRLYVAAGSSCDYCREHEVIRASVASMDPDGTHQQIMAHGMRNAVDLRFVPDFDGGSLFATNMGDDHLGTGEPEDTFFELEANARPRPASEAAPANYGWPTCFFANGKPTLDKTPLPELTAEGDPEKFAEHPPTAAEERDSSYGAQPGMQTQGTLTPAAGGRTHVVDPNANLGTVPAPLTDCSHVPAAFNTFPAHSSPLGLAYFGDANPRLRGSFLVALHGASSLRVGTGYRVVRFSAADRTPQPFITGFLKAAPGGVPQVQGRPCGLLRVGQDAFLLTDDKLGLVYYIHPHSPQTP